VHGLFGSCDWFVQTNKPNNHHLTLAEILRGFFQASLFAAVEMVNVEQAPNMKGGGN
jgi:hypothetical protein